MALSSLIHLWDSNLHRETPRTKCGLKVRVRTNVLYASTAEKLKIPPNAVCKVCYRLGPPWLVVVK